MTGLLSDPRIGREFLTADEVESLPVGAVVIDSDGDAWQRGAGDNWLSGSALESRVRSEELVESYGGQLLVWIPPGSELKGAAPGPFPSLADHEVSRVTVTAGGAG